MLRGQFRGPCGRGGPCPSPQGPSAALVFCFSNRLAPWLRASLLGNHLFFTSSAPHPSETTPGKHSQPTCTPAFTRAAESPGPPEGPGHRALCCSQEAAGLLERPCTHPAGNTDLNASLLQGHVAQDHSSWLQSGRGKTRGLSEALERSQPVAGKEPSAPCRPWGSDLRARKLQGAQRQPAPAAARVPSRAETMVSMSQDRGPL